MADRNVPATDTIEDLRATYNGTSTDVGDFTNLNASFTGTPTDVIEAIGTKASKGFSVAIAAALG